LADEQNKETRSFDQELNTDVRDYHVSKRSWTYSRNGIPNSKSGDIGDLGNEPSNKSCINTPYKIIGFIYLYADNWAVFSTDNTNSEIGFFTEGICSYKKIVNDPCLNFNQANLITGVSKKNHDCSWHIYWADQNRNPDRQLNIDNVPYKQNCVLVGGCLQCTPLSPLQLDCDLTRLARLTGIPCLQVKKGASGGSLPNGSYMVTIAYTINGQKVTDYLAFSDVQSLFEHSGIAGSIDIILSNLDTTYDDFELVVVSVVNQQTVAKKLGIYSTRQTQITVDILDPKLVTVPLEFLPIHNPIVDSSDAIYEVNDYLLRLGPTNKFDFNYQPLANQISAKWISVEYPADYYRKGGKNPSFMRDENYAFFIQWEYNDGDFSSSYHIPGRAPTANDVQVLAGQDTNIEVSEGLTPFRWRVQNTAAVTSLATVVLPDGGIQIAEGSMGYWESTELYPNNKPLVYTTLCGLPIRHHKFPDNALHPNTRHFINSSANFGGAPAVRVMGVTFDNIQVPLNNAGNPITNIVGYRILRGSREGNKTVIAKGMLNNMFEYTIEGGITSRTGLYPNYPYNDLSKDIFISTTKTSTNLNGLINNYNPNTSYSQENFTFHSPDTQFRRPFLSMRELKIYGHVSGATDGSFVQPERHPLHKLITDQCFYVSVIAGSAAAFLSVNGKRTTSFSFPQKTGFEDSGQFTLSGYTSGNGTFGHDNSTTIAFDAAGSAAQSAMQAAHTAAYNLNYTTGAQLGINVTGGNAQTYYGIVSGSAQTAQSPEAMTGFQKNIVQDDGAYDSIPPYIAALQAIPTFVNYISQGAETVLRLFKALMPFQQYALQYQSHCFYDTWNDPTPNVQRYGLEDLIYLSNQIQDFGTNFRVNNLYRGNSVAVHTKIPVINPSAPPDNTRVTVGKLGIWSDPTQPFTRSAKSHYVGLKNRLLNQYGQIGGVQQIPFGCDNKVTVKSSGNIPVKTPVMFGGDTYITRYTEKNTMFFFYDWLYDQPDGTDFDYLDRRELPFPAYWMDTRDVNFPEFLGSFVTNLTAPSSWLVPSKNRVVDAASYPSPFAFPPEFLIKQAYFYLFNSGVRDFFVESEVNTDYRDWGDADIEHFYDPYRYTDLRTLFNSKTIKTTEIFKYDYSLSISKLFLNFISWANIQPINYDPLIYATCYVNYPNRIIYSLQQQFELIRDNWTIYLANNYKDFKNRVIAVQSINKSGALIFFDTDTPVQFYGVDQLQTTNGTKFTIGDGGLFSQPMQNVMNSDKSYEYGSCQSRRSIVNTPSGLFWISEGTGKIYSLQTGEITNNDNKWWFALYLPYALTVTFPNFALTDNPVIGIGCQTIYDNENTLLYFTKRDFKLRSDLPPGTLVAYVGADNFLVNKTLPVKLGDPKYFEDASWTISYDPKTQSWISWHDWHPNLLMPGKNTFLSTFDKGIWVHNEVCDSYCNYYGVDYPFEVEYIVNTVQQVNTLRSIEYQLEVYKYDVNCHDRYLYLEENFDEAVVYNEEQCSGLLKLTPTPNNDPQALIPYPIFNPTSVSVLYSKVESKYRFNMFYDLTDDRGQFSAARRMIWNTPANGYAKTLNPLNLNYSKDPHQQKRFRGYTMSVLLRRKVSGDKKFLFILTNNKDHLSMR